MVIERLSAAEEFVASKLLVLEHIGHKIMRFVLFKC